MSDEGENTETSTEICPGVIKHNLAKGDALFNEGDKSDNVFLVQAGSVKVFKKLDGEEMQLGEIRKNQVLGEVAFLNQTPRMTSAVASEHSVVLELKLEPLRSYLEDQPEWLRILINSMASHLTSANHRILELSQ
jgi:CRP-like cAMP-binding protein